MLFEHADADGKQAFAIHWEPPPESKYKWKHKHPPKPKTLRIYECHVGISGQDPKVASFDVFIQKAILQVILHLFSLLLSLFPVIFCPSIATSFIFIGPASRKRSWLQCNPIDWTC